MGRKPKNLTREQQKAMFAKMNQDKPKPKVYNLQKLNPSADYDPVPSVFQDKKYEDTLDSEDNLSTSKEGKTQKDKKKKKPTTRIKKTEDHVKLGIYVPSTKQNGKHITAKEHARRIAETETYLRQTFGGSTSVQGFGTWKDPETGIEYAEDVAVVETYTDPKTYREKNSDLVKYVKTKKKDWRQESVMVEMEDLQKHRVAEGAHYL